MKIIKYLTIVLLLFNCSNDDLNNITDSDFYGEWWLLSATADRPIDYDADGNAAFDIKDDFSCFTIVLILKEDNSFSESIIDRPVDEGSINCFLVENFGTWQYLERTNEIEFNYLDENGDIVESYRRAVIVNDDSSLEYNRIFYDVDGVFNAKMKFGYINF